jgi:hypothetical protein
MGWLIKGLVLVAGLVSLTLGAFFIWVPCFGYLAYTLWSATRKPKVYVHDEKKERGTPKGRGSRFKKRYIAACASLVLSAVAFIVGGALAPWVFLATGSLILVSGVFNLGPSFTRVEQVPDSILLRRKWLPFSWVSLVEVKFGTQQMSKALSSVGCDIMMTVSSERVSVYLPVGVRALTAPSAESKVTEKLGPIARMLSAKGAYTLPLESKEAAAKLDWSLEPVYVALEYGRDGVVSLNSTPFDVLVLAPSAHLLESAAAYVAVPNRKQGRYRVPGKGRKLASRPLLWEALEVLAERHAPENADAVTGFLSSVSASRGESVGDRLENGGRTETGKIVVGSVGSQQVELTRPQLRAIVRAYG